jgi:hypothetical protein
VPRRLPSGDAIALFRDQNFGPVNFLNLDVRKQNEIPSCLVDLPAYSILRDLREHNESGKRTERQPFDLSACVAFHICGKAGVLSFPHMDHHGKLTTIFCDEGEKLWLMWPHLQEAELHRWATTDDVAPDLAPFPLYLGPGYFMFQPQETIHAPYSISDVLMTGTAHWDSRQMVRVLRQSLYERRYPKITNEDPAKEFGIKLRILEKLWRQKHQAWPWGTEEQLTEYSTLLKVGLPSLHQISDTNGLQEWETTSPVGRRSMGCNCQTGCLRKSCVCRKSRRQCGPFCHLKDKPGIGCEECQNT